jgi:hypothetical protein
MENSNPVVAAAINEIDLLCKGKQWRMSIPVQDTDSDVVISSAIMSLTVAADEQQQMYKSEFRKFFDEAETALGLLESNDLTALEQSLRYMKLKAMALG